MILGVVQPLSSRVRCTFKISSDRFKKILVFVSKEAPQVHINKGDIKYALN